MNIHEIAGVELVPAKRKNLPNRILRAFDNAMHIGGLSRSVKHTLAEICRFIPQDRPFDTVFAHKSTIATRTGASERTVYRHLATLQEQKLIEVLEQDRKSRNGRFTVSRIRLTRYAAALLGFLDGVEENRTRAEPAPADATACAASFDSTLEIIHRQPSAKMTAGHTLSEPTNSKNQPPQRTENGLPKDLTWLTGNGLSRAGIFKLMGKAGANRKRLSDIVTVVKDHIQDLKGGRLYAYLAKLAAGPSDFAVAAANERQRQRQAHQAAAMARKADGFRLRFRNTCLTNPEQTRLYVIDERAQFARIFGDNGPSTIPLHDLTEWIERIESGRLVMATLAAERRLMT
jgi:DNA-binding transcriptional ArsR family regulator